MVRSIEKIYFPVSSNLKSKILYFASSFCILIFAFSITSSADAAGTITQRAYILQNDDAANGNPNSVSSAAANTAMTGVKNGQRFIVRFQIDGTASKSNWQIQYDKNDSHWQNVGVTSASYQAFDPTPLFSFGNIASRALTTNLAGTCNGGATFVNGEIPWNSNVINTFGLGTGNKCSEVAFGVRTASIAYNSTYRFRLNITNVASGSVSTFSQYPTVTTVTSGNDTNRYSKYIMGPPMTASKSAGFLTASSSYQLFMPLDSLGYASVSTDNSKFDMLASMSSHLGVGSIASASNLFFQDTAGMYKTSSSSINAIGWNGTFWLVGQDNHFSKRRLTLISQNRDNSFFTDVSSKLSNFASNSVEAISWNGSYWLVGGGGRTLNRCNFDVTACVRIASNSFSFNSADTIKSIHWNGAYWAIGGSYANLSRCNVDVTTCTRVSGNLSNFASSSINTIYSNGANWLVGGATAKLNKCNINIGSGDCTQVSGNLSNFASSSIDAISWNGTYWLVGGEVAKLNRCTSAVPSGGCTYVSPSLSNFASSSIQSINWNGTHWLISGEAQALNRCNIDVTSCIDISSNLANYGEPHQPFSSDGVITATGETTYTMAVDSNYIYYAGIDSLSWYLDKRNRVTGNICSSTANCVDGGFGTAGTITEVLTTFINSIAIDSNYLYVAGYNDSNDWQINKYNKVTGNICSSTARCADGNFGTSGVVTTAGGTFAYSMAIDSNYIYIAGEDPNADWRIEKRNRVTGNICDGTANCAEGNFGTSGVVTVAGTNGNTAYSIALDSSYIYIAGDDNTNADWRIEKRNRVTGNICDGTANCAEGNFGTSGVIAVTGGTIARSVTVDSNYVYIFGSGDGADWRTEKRNRVTGNICDGTDNCADGAFDTDGIITVALSSGEGRQVVVDSKHLYLAGNSNVSNRRTEKRNRVTGQLCNSTVGNCTESGMVESAAWNGTSWLAGGGTLDGRLNRCSFDGAVCEDLFEGVKVFGTNIKTVQSGTSSGITRWLIGGASAKANRCGEDLASCSFVTLSNFSTDQASTSHFANSEFAIGGGNATSRLNSCGLTGSCTDRSSNLTATTNAINAVHGSGSYWVVGGTNRFLDRCPIAWGACTSVAGNLSAGWVAGDAVRAVLWTGSRWFIGGGVADIDTCTGSDVTSCTAVTLATFDSNNIMSLGKSNSYLLVGGTDELNRCNLDGTSCTNVSNNLANFASTSFNSIHWNGSYWLIGGASGKLNSCNSNATFCVDLSSNISNVFAANAVNSVNWSGNYWLIGGASAKLVRAYERFPVYHFVTKHTNNSDDITVTWNGKSTTPAASKSFTFQAFNFNTNKWETKTTNTTLAADTEGTINGTVTSNNSNYYDSNLYTHWRFYQQAGLETLSTDYISFSFEEGAGDPGQSGSDWTNRQGTGGGSSEQGSGGGTPPGGGTGEGTGAGGSGGGSGGGTPPPPPPGGGDEGTGGGASPVMFYWWQWY